MKVTQEKAFTLRGPSLEGSRPLPGSNFVPLEKSACPQLQSFPPAPQDRQGGGGVHPSGGGAWTPCWPLPSALCSPSARLPRLARGYVLRSPLQAENASHTPQPLSIAIQPDLPELCSACSRWPSPGHSPLRSLSYHQESNICNFSDPVLQVKYRRVVVWVQDGREMPVDLCDHGADWGLPLAAGAQGLAQEKNSKFQVVSTECISLLHHCKVENS